MEQRQPRLGDILDDYCPRERRITNHAVVAMLGEKVKQTRCVTCEAEHVYKEAKVPRLRRRKESVATLPDQVLDEARTDEGKSDRSGAGRIAQAEADLPTQTEAPPAAEEAAPVDEAGATQTDGPVHRPLIRATLPRPERPAQPRQLPDFTVRQQGNRNGGFRDGDRQGPRGGGPPGKGGKPSGPGAGKHPGRGRQAQPRGQAGTRATGRPGPQGSRGPREHLGRHGKKRTR